MIDKIVKFIDKRTFASPHEDVKSIEKHFGIVIGGLLL